MPTEVVVAGEGVLPPPPRRWTAERLARASYKDSGSPAQVEERFLRHLLSSFLPSTTIEIHHKKNGYKEHLREEEQGLLVVDGAKAGD